MTGQHAEIAFPARHCDHNGGFAKDDFLGAHELKLELGGHSLLPIKQKGTWGIPHAFLNGKTI
jgi:hypothetical protein